MSTVVEILPPELFAQTVNVTVAVTAVGMPVNAPVSLSKSMPDGKSSYESIHQFVDASPVLSGETVPMPVFLVNVNGVSSYTMLGA